MSSALAPAKPDGPIYRMEIAVPASVWPDLYAEPSPKQLAAKGTENLPAAWGMYCVTCEA